VDLVAAELAAHAQVAILEREPVGDLELQDQLAKYLPARLGSRAEVAEGVLAPA
jgi:hypothetical protein